jgi:tetratricopeptide (TPR) repeat protein
VKIFADDEVIDRWWRASSYRLRALWIYDDEYAEVTLKWLQDSAVTKNISEEERKWVKSLSSKSELDADLLEHIGRFIARKWLQNGQGDVAYMLNAVRGYITKVFYTHTLPGNEQWLTLLQIENRKDPKIERFINGPDAEPVQASQILNAAKWAQARIGLDTLGYEENRNLARTLREFGKYDEAIEHFKLTSTLAQDNWFSQWGLAGCYADREEYTTAIEILEATKEGIENGEIGNAEELRDELAEMNRVLAAWNKEAGRSEISLTIYEKLLQEFPHDYDTALAHMTLLHK